MVMMMRDINSQGMLRAKSSRLDVAAAFCCIATKTVLNIVFQVTAFLKGWALIGDLDHCVYYGISQCYLTIFQNLAAGSSQSAGISV